MNLSQQNAALQLLSILEGKEDFGLYSRRIEQLLRDLGYKEPSYIWAILNKPRYRQRLILSLRAKLLEWQSENPASTSQISDQKQFEIFEKLLTGIGSRDWDSVTDLIAQLGFSSNIVHNLQSDSVFRRQTFDILVDKISAWRRDRPWIEHIHVPYMEDRYGAIDPLTRHYLHNELRYELESTDVKSLRFNALFSSPESIVAAEHELGLPITGDKNRFTHNYRRQYYTSDCRYYNAGVTCNILALKTGTLQEAVDAIKMAITIQGEIVTLAMIPRYEAIDQLLADKEFTQTESRDILELSRFLLEVAANALAEGREDLYQNYMHEGISHFDRARTLWPINLHFRRTFKSMLGRVLETGNFDLVKKVFDDMIQNANHLGVNYNLKEFYDHISYNAGRVSTIELLERLKETEWYNFVSVANGMSEKCNPKMIEWIAPQFDQVFPAGDTQLRHIMEFAAENLCFEMFRLAFDKLKNFPNLGYDNHRTLFKLEYTGEMLRLYLDTYLDTLSDQELEDYLKYLSIMPGAVLNIEVMLSYPRVLQHIRNRYGSVMSFILNLDQVIVILNSLYSFIVQNEYDSPYIYPEMMRKAILLNNIVLFEAYANYYINRGRNLSLSDYNILEKTIRGTSMLDYTEDFEHLMGELSWLVPD